MAHLSNQLLTPQAKGQTPGSTAGLQQPHIQSTLPGRSTPAAPPVVSTRLIPAAEWNDYHPWPPIGGLRHLIFHAKAKGFDQVVHRAGRRVLIDEAAFFGWVAQQRGQR